MALSRNATPSNLSSVVMTIEVVIMYYIVVELAASEIFSKCSQYHYTESDDLQKPVTSRLIAQYFFTCPQQTRLIFVNHISFLHIAFRSTSLSNHSFELFSDKK